MSTTFGPDSAHLAALDAVLARLQSVERRIREAEAERLELLAEAFDIAAAETADRAGSSASGQQAELAYRAVRAEVAACLHESEYAVERRMTHAVALTRGYRRTFEAYASGSLSERHTRVITDAGAVIGTDDSPDTRERRAAYEYEILPFAVAETPTRLRPAARLIAEQHTRASFDERHQAARALRRVWVEDRDDGMADLIAHLPAVEAHAIKDRLTRLAVRIEQAGAMEPTDAESPDARGAGRRRCRDEIRADQLVELLLGSEGSVSDLGAVPHGTSEPVRAVVQVIMGAGVLQLPELQSHGPIDSDTARDLAGNASHWEMIRTDAVTGDILSVERYRPSEEMRRLLRARDRHCRFFGCRTPATRSDIDHTVDAARGGPTSTDNLAHLCRGHHTLKHHTGWRVEQREAGTLDWTSPTGRTHRDRPPSRVRFTASGQPPPPQPPDTG